MTHSCLSCQRTVDWKVRLQRSGVLLNGAWLCSEECLCRFLTARISEVQRTSALDIPPAPRIPLGLSLLQRGSIDMAQLSDALVRQQRFGGRLGVHLQQVAGITEHEIAVTVARQWSVPFLEIADPSTLPTVSVVPIALLEAAGALITHLHHPSRTLYLAFTHRVDRSLVRAVQAVTGWNAVPCVARASALAAGLHQLAASAREEATLPATDAPAYAAEVVCAYARQHRSRTIRFAHVQPHLWIRLDNETPYDLVCPILARRIETASLHEDALVRSAASVL